MVNSQLKWTKNLRDIFYTTKQRVWVLSIEGGVVGPWSDLVWVNSLGTICSVFYNLTDHLRNHTIDLDYVGWVVILI